MTLCSKCGEVQHPIGEPQDAHIRAAEAEFRKTGFSIAAYEWKRSPEALAALLSYNGLVPDAKVPFGWKYHPNAWSAANWKSYFGEHAKG